ncbi:MAG: HAD-IA family hydrolase [Candidatus Aenigmarchaeota archaeon]|nr:HAD-IA family hydrolase [Candidatus Aenigmarchaeota archaeon]
MSVSPKAFILDVDGVLRDSAPPALEGMSRGFAACGLDARFSVRDYRTIRAVGKYNNSRNCIALMLALYREGRKPGQFLQGDPEKRFDALVSGIIRPEDRDTIERIRKVYKDFSYSPEAGDYVRILPKVPEALRLLKRAGFALAIWTNSGRATVERDLGPLLARFAHLLAGEDTQVKKPDPRGIFLVCKKLHLPPAEAAYVGDAAVDIQAAKAAGAASIALTSEVPDPRLLRRERPDLVFPDLYRMAKHFCAGR